MAEFVTPPFGFNPDDYTTSINDLRKIAREFNVTVSVARRWVLGVPVRKTEVELEEKSSKKKIVGPDMVSPPANEVNEAVKMYSGKAPDGTLIASHGLEIDKRVSAEQVEVNKKILDPFLRSEKKNPFPQSPIKICDKSMTIPGDCLIIFDLHNPTYDADFLHKAVLLAKKYGIHNTLFGGDLNNSDQWNAKHMLAHKRRFQDDLEILSSLVNTLRDEFDQDVYAILGNHDNWWMSYLKGEFDADWIFSKLVGNMIVSPMEWCHVESGGTIFQIEHGANYSGANPLAVAQKLSAKYMKPIIMGHQHHWASGFDLSGNFQCIASGGMFDARRIRYVNEKHKTNPTMTQGFVLIKDGWAEHYTPRHPEILAL